MIRRTPLTPYWHARKAGFHGGYRHYGVTTLPLPILPLSPPYAKDLPKPKRGSRRKRTSRLASCDVCGVHVPEGKLRDLHVRCASHILNVHEEIRDHASVWDKLEHDRVWIEKTRSFV